ncbi:MAG: hypothetical protein ACJ746_10380 [Bryobacteraceae bacterium]
MSPIVRFVISSITFGVLSLNPDFSADEPFKPGPAASYPHQTSGPVTIGAKVYNKEELTDSAFGKKLDLLKYGVLPVLLVVENNGKEAVDLQRLEVNLVASDGRHAPAVSPDELIHLGSPSKRPGIKQTPIPMPKKKNPLNSPELVMRSFSAKMLPPGDSASGFFYFEAKSEPKDKLYVNGMREARSGKEIFYFEFPLEEQP